MRVLAFRFFRKGEEVANLTLRLSTRERHDTFDFSFVATSMKPISDHAAKNSDHGALHADALLPLLDGLDLVAKVLDATGRVTFCNDALLRLLGCSSSEVIGFNWFEKFLEGEEQTGVIQLFQGILHECNIELRHQNSVVCKDGTRRLVSWNNAPLRDADSAICGMISIGTDVTQNRQTDQELQLSRSRFKMLFQNASAGMVLTEAREGGRILQANDALCRLLGYAQSDLETMSAFDITHPDDHAAMLEAGSKQMEGISEPTTFEKRLLHTDGTWRWAMISTSLVRDAAGEPLHFISQIGDISEQKRAQGELQNARALNDAIIAGTSDGLLVCDRDWRILVWNPFLEKMTGQEAARVLAQPVLESLNKIRHSVRRLLNATMKGEQAKTGDFPWTFADGSKHWLSCSVVPLRSEQNEIIGAIGAVHDVTARKTAEQARKASEDQMRLMMNQITDSLLMHDLEGNLVDVNEAACRALGYSRKELLTTPLQKVAPLYDSTRVLALAKDDAIPPFESEKKRRDGSTFPVEVSVRLFHSGTRQLVMRQARDITEQRGNAEALLRTNAILEATQEASAEGICLVDPSGHVVRFNRRFAELWQIPEEALPRLKKSRQIMSFVLDQLEQPDEFIERLNYLYDNATVSVRDEIVLRDGRVFDRYSAPALSPQGVSYGRVWIFSDITQRKQWEQKLEQQAFYDSLTGLPNRALFIDRLSQASNRARRQSERNALLFLDLDRFKVINDSLGHEAGDRLLLAVAERLRGCLRPGDTAARLGGDEFVILLQGAKHLDAVTRVAERVAESLQAPFHLGQHEVYTAASIGIVMETDEIATPDDLLRSADLAMYRAKSRGGARYELFDEAMSIGAIEALNLETELRRALERDELTVAYQPVVSLHDTRIIGAEALIRWNNAGRGPVAPGDFIPMAEATGLILPLGRHVLKQSCAAARDWNEREYSHEKSNGTGANGAASKNASSAKVGREITVSVNLSARQFQQPELLQEVRTALEISRLAPRNLMLEITESVVMEDAESTAVTLRALKELGVRLAIDDFGTGYSSLAYLRRFPVDILKIDRAFVSKMTGADTEDAAIVRAIVTLAKTLGMRVTAEGVETEQQLHHLRDLGCDYAQGFLFSHALPDAEIALQFGCDALASTRNGTG